jgi:hypothetical protein
MSRARFAALGVETDGEATGENIARALQRR